MKAKMKKTLALFLSVLMLFSLMTVSSSAAEECKHDLEAGSTLEFLGTKTPTCVDGYDEYRCTVCGKKFPFNTTNPVMEHKYRQVAYHKPECEKRGYTELKCDNCADTIYRDYVDPLGHNLVITGYTLSGETDDRSNPFYTQHSICTVCKKNFDDENYYRVKLVKNVLVNGEEVQQDITGDGCFDGYYYAKKDSKVPYSGTPTLDMVEYPNDFGAWEFVNWKRSDESGRTDLDMVTEPMTALAMFQADQVQFKVIFLNIYGEQIGKTQIVDYKHAATAPKISQTIKDEHAIYTFVGWETKFDCVTEDLVVEPHYDCEMEQVKVVFMDYDRKTELLTKTCNWGTQISEIAPNLEDRPADEDYVYAFSGDWLNAKGDVQKEANGEYISLYPDYIKSPIKYTVVISVLCNGTGAAGASYQITASNGNLMGQGYTDNSGRATVSIPNGIYKVLCASSDKLYAGDTTFRVNTAGGSTSQTNVTVTLVENSEYYEDESKNCTCICHGLLSPIWIKVLNLMYSVFNIRYVCCNDMFATHGDQLKYTAV